jgi:hypothetical protein
MEFLILIVFFLWLQQTEADEPGSVQYNYQVWRQQRNEQVISETQLQAIAAGAVHVSLR